MQLVSHIDSMERGHVILNENASGYREPADAGAQVILARPARLFHY